MGKPGSGTTQKPKAAPSPKRILVKRQLPPQPGAGQIVVVKRGEDIRESLQSRWNAMSRDSETVEFFWHTVMTNPTYNETKEWPDHHKLVMSWEIREGVKTLFDFRSKMRRLKAWIDYFQPLHDYELTVDEVVEIHS